MAVVVTFDSGHAGRDKAFPREVRRGTIALGTYATNGVAVTKATFDLWHSLADLRVDPAGGYVPRFDLANSKVLVYDQKDPAAAGGADIPLPEVANNTDLSGTSFRFVATGK